jgi:16S rRNA G1207 methylase RsmC
MPLLVDYPWGELGKATVVDVGCGAGDSGIDVMKMYPDISWVFQDLNKQVLADVEKVDLQRMGRYG